MQYWFYSAEVWKDGEMIRRVSGTCPDEQYAQSLSLIADFNNPKQVIDYLIGLLSELDTERIVHFTAFNRV